MPKVKFADQRHEEDEDEDEEDEGVGSSDNSSEEDGDREDVVDDLNYDLYNLASFDYHGLRLPEDDVKKEAALVQKTTRAVQLLVNKIFSLPIETDDTGPLAVLPSDDVTKMPRAQRIPEPKPLTKWEKFAAEKGIKKTKRERMVFDESRQEYAPRYGYKRVNGGIEDQPIVEIKAGQDPFLDPWENARVEKKQRVARNLKNQAKNQERAEGKGKSKGKIDDPLSFGKIKDRSGPVNSFLSCTYSDPFTLHLTSTIV
jgi:hypothetical protein